MNLYATVIIMLTAVIVAAWSLWGSRRKRPLGEVSLVPWTGILFVALVVLFVMVAHLVSLLTGQPLRSGGFQAQAF